MAAPVDGFHRGERRGAGLFGLHRARLAEHDPPQLAVAAETERPGPRTVRLDAEHEAFQGGIVDRAFALAGPGRMRDCIGQAVALGHWSASPPSSMSAWPSSPAATRRPSPPLTATAANEWRRSWILHPSHRRCGSLAKFRPEAPKEGR